MWKGVAHYRPRPRLGLSTKGTAFSNAFRVNRPVCARLSLRRVVRFSAVLNSNYSQQERPAS